MKLTELHRRVHDAEKALHTAIEERFAPGARVHVRWGDHKVKAVALSTAWGRVEVRNEATGREYWVDATRLVEFDRL